MIKRIITFLLFTLCVFLVACDIQTTIVDVKNNQDELGLLDGDGNSIKDGETDPIKGTEGDGEFGGETDQIKGTEGDGESGGETDSTKDTEGDGSDLIEEDVFYTVNYYYQGELYDSVAVKAGETIQLISIEPDYYVGEYWVDADENKVPSDLLIDKDYNLYFQYLGHQDLYPSQILLRQDTSYFLLHPVAVGNIVNFEVITSESEEQMEFDYEIVFADKESVVEKIDNHTYKFIRATTVRYTAYLLDKDGNRTDVCSPNYVVNVNDSYGFFIIGNGSKRAAYYDATLDRETEYDKYVSIRGIFSLSEERFMNDVKNGKGLILKDGDKLSVDLIQLIDSVISDVDPENAHIENVRFINESINPTNQFTIDEEGVIHVIDGEYVDNFSIYAEYNIVAKYYENDEIIEKVFYQKIELK